jgi:hypothetical protein
MFQIGMLVLALGLFLGGLLPLLGYETGKQKTKPVTAVVMMVFSVGLAVFALVVLPGLLAPSGSR